MSNRAIVIIFAGFLTCFIGFAVRYTYGILLPYMLEEFQISKTEAGVIYSSYFIAYTVAVPFIGMLADRFNIRIIVTLATIFIGTSTVLLSYSTSVTSASLFFTIAGLGHAACWVPYAVLIHRWVKDKWRGTALTFTEAGSSVGIITVSAVMPFITREFDWRMGWFILGMVAFVVSLFNISLAASPPQNAHISDKKPAAGVTQKKEAGFLSTIGDSKFWLLGMAYFLTGFLILVPFTFLPTYAFQELHMSFQTASGFVTLIGIAGVSGKLLLGTLSDRLGRLQMMITAGFLLAVGCLGMVIFKQQSMLSVFTVIFGLGYGAVWPIYAAAIPDYFSGNRTGLILSLWGLLLGIGSIASPVISGWVIDTSGSFPLAFAIASGTAVVSLILLFTVGKPARFKDE